MIKKIVFVNKNYYSFKNFRLAFAKRLLRKNICHQIISIFGGPIPKNKKQEKISYFSFPISQNFYNLKNDINFIFSLRKFLVKINPEMVHFFNARPMLLGSLSLLFLKKNIKIYATVTGLGHFYLSNNYFLKIVLFILFYFSFNKVNKIFFHNRDDKKYFKKKFLLRKVKSIVTFGQGIKIKNKKIKKINFKKISFGFVARLTKEKGFLEYLDSIKIFQQFSHYKKYAEFGYIENFDHDSSVAISRECLNEKLKIIKIKKYKFLNTSSYLNNFDVIVFPSYREGCSKTLMEACNFGKFIIATNVPGCNNVVKNNINGYLVREKKPDSLFYAYEKVFKKKKRIYEMQKKAQLIAKKKI